MSRFKGQGGRQLKPKLTKNEMERAYDHKFKALSDSLQAIQQFAVQQLSKNAMEIAQLKRQLEAIDYRSVATRDLAIAANIFSDEGHTDHARTLRIKDFETESAADDKKRGLLPVAVDEELKLGYWATLVVSAVNPDMISVPSVKDQKEVLLKSVDGKTEAIEAPTELVPHPQAGQKIDELSSLRSKIQVGAGSLMPELEMELIGLKINEEKDIPLKIPPRYGQFAGKDVIFKVKVLDLKKEAPKPNKEDEDVKEPKAKEAAL